MPLTQMVSFSLKQTNQKAQQAKTLLQAKTKHSPKLGLGLGLPVFSSARILTEYLKDVA